MALKSPQQIQITPLADTPGTRFQSSVAPKIDTGFLDKMHDKLDADQRAEQQAAERKARENLTYLKAKFNNEADSLRIDAQAEVTDYKGIQALKKEPEVSARYQRDLNKRLEEYPPEYHQYLQLEAEQATTKLKGATIPYVHNEVNALRKDTFKTRLNNDINSLIERSGDIEHVKTDGLATVMRSAEVALQREYGEDPNRIVDPNSGVTAGQMINEGKQKAASSALMGSVVQQAKTGGVLHAQKLYEEFNDEMTPADRIKAAEAIRLSKEDGQSRASIDLANMAMREYPENPQAQELYARANATSTKDYNAIMGVINSQNKMATRAKKQNIEKVKGKIYTDLDANKFNPADANLLPPEERTKLFDELNKNGGGPARLTDWDTHDKVLDNMGRDRSYAKNVNLAALRGKIDPQRLEVMQRIQNRVKNQDADEVLTAQRGDPNMLKDIVDDYFLSKKITGKQVKGEIKSFVYDRMETLLQTHKNATPRQIRNMLKADLYNYGTKTVTVPRGGPLNPLSYFRAFDKDKIAANPDLVRGTDGTMAADNSGRLQELTTFYTTHPNFKGKSKAQINKYIEAALKKK